MTIEVILAKKNKTRTETMEITITMIITITRMLTKPMMTIVITTKPVITITMIKL